MGPVEKLIHSKKRKHFTLVDPDKGILSKERIEKLEELGTDGVMIGGSTGVSTKDTDRMVLVIQKYSDLPTILFPGSIKGVSKHADALFFMSLLNSRDPFWISGIQKKAAPMIRKMDIESIPMAYLVVEPGMKVGKVGKADLIKRNHPKLAAAYAKAAQHIGFRLVYLEAGSGARTPVPAKMVKTVKKNIAIPLIVGGGIRKPVQARAAARAGANVIVTGTITEENFNKVGAIIKAAKSIR